MGPSVCVGVKDVVIGVEWLAIDVLVVSMPPEFIKKVLRQKKKMTNSGTPQTNAKQHKPIVPSPTDRMMICGSDSVGVG